ncbi:putative galacturonosyltransferase 14 [Hordeum vulgare]|nr:putative galacturonosyltransferase 14 [Hordeum vulgare]
MGKKVGFSVTLPTPRPVAPARATPWMPVDDYATTTSNLFYEMGERDDLHNATTEFVNLLADNTIDIEQVLIGYYGYNELDGGVRDYGEEDKEHALLSIGSR